MFIHTEQFVAYCMRELQFEKQISINYKSLPLCIIDCIYSLRARYYSSTIPVVKRYAARYLNNDVSNPNERVSDLIRHIEEEGGPEAFAEHVLKNHQKSGRVLKAEACLQLARYLSWLHIETIRDFQDCEHPELLEIIVRSVKGIGDAGTNYLFMLAGDQNRCKPDTHIHHCIRDACGEDISNDDCQVLFKEAVGLLPKEVPGLTVAKLDGVIWRKYSLSVTK